MKKRIISLTFLLAFLFSTSLPSYALDNYDGRNNDLDTVTSISEYQMAQNETRELSGNAQGPTPLEEYEIAFRKLAEMDSDVLSNCGYSDEEITLMKAYLNGEVSFDEAASRAATVLTATLSCPVHTSTQYTASYYWSWDKLPTGLNQDAFALSMVGFNGNGIAIGGVYTLQSSSVRYYLENTFHHYEVPTTSISSGFSATYESYKLDSTHSYWVWAKEGNVSLILTPMVSGTTFSAVRARGAVFHSTSTFSHSFEISVSLWDGSITFSIVGNNINNITEYGTKQYVFYNNGSFYAEQS